MRGPSGFPTSNPRGTKFASARNAVPWSSKKTEREMVAYHEAGHTIIHLQTSLLPPLYKVSIVPRGQALGVTTLLPDEDQISRAKSFCSRTIRPHAGGRAAGKNILRFHPQWRCRRSRCGAKNRPQDDSRVGHGRTALLPAGKTDAEVEIQSPAGNGGPTGVCRDPGSKGKHGKAGAGIVETRKPARARKCWNYLICLNRKWRQPLPPEELREPKGRSSLTASETGVPRFLLAGARTLLQCRGNVRVPRQLIAITSCPRTSRAVAGPQK